MLSEADCARAIGPLEAILAHIEETITAGAGEPEQILERLATVLESGRVDHISIQVPTGDMTYDEARRTVELFASEIKPELEKQFAMLICLRTTSWVRDHRHTPRSFLIPR